MTVVESGWMQSRRRNPVSRSFVVLGLAAALVLGLGAGARAEDGVPPIVAQPTDEPVVPLMALPEPAPLDLGIPAEEAAPDAPLPAAIPPPSTATPSGDGRDAILLNFEAADIREVIYTFAAALNLNYWIDPRVQGQVTARSFGPIYVDDLFPVFLQILRSNGYSAVKQGDIYMIVPAEETKTRARVGAGDGGGDRFVIDLVKVTHVSAERIVEMLSPFVSPGGDVVAYPRNNLVVITDLSSNAKRLRELVQTFDNDSFRDLSGKVYKINHASLDEIAEELVGILEAYHVVETGSRVQVIPLLRLNSIAVVAFDPSVFANVEYWLSVLDVPGGAGAGRRVYVYKVENSKAVEIADVLNELYESLAEEASDALARPRSGALAERGQGLGGGLSSARDRAQEGRSQQRVQNMEAAAVLGDAAEGGLTGVFEQEIRVVADEITNSLLVLATPRDYQMVKAVLAELDIVPRQVLVEMLIAEITLGDDMSLGMTHTFGNGTSTNTDGDDEDDDPAALSTGLANVLFDDDDSFRVDGVIGGPGLDATLSFFGGDYTATLTALANRNKLKVLSRPHILTADNQEARILVGAEIPIVTSQSDSGSQDDGDSVFRQNVEYRDTGVVVHVTPQVNSEGLVNMIIAQEVSDIAGSTLQIEGIVSPSFTTRETETTVVVHSGETIVIGGIIADTKRESASGVPFLMDIPVLGQLFRARTKEAERTELIILITPYVVRDRNEARSLTDEFKQRVDRLLRELQVDESVPGSHTAVLETAAPN
jgi:general secretion pathway protein D